MQHGTVKYPDIVRNLEPVVDNTGGMAFLLSIPAGIIVSIVLGIIVKAFLM